MADLLRPSAIRAAATLRLADHIASGATNLAELTERTAARPELLDMLLRYLVTLKVLRRDADGAYRVTELGAALADDDPAGLRRHLSMDGLFGRADLALVNILHTVRTGEPCHSTVFGRGYWDSINEDPVFLAALEDNDATELYWDAHHIVDAYQWAQVRHVVDVGGHTGTLLMALLYRYPHLYGTLVDLKNAVDVAGRRFVRAGLAHRCETVAGSFFDPLPRGGDVYMLSAILADWTDEQAVTILRRCGEAAGGAGKVLLAEVTMDVRSAGGESAAAELWLRATMPAPARTVDELTVLAKAAGLRLTWQGPVTPVRSVLEFSSDVK